MERRPTRYGGKTSSLPPGKERSGVGLVLLALFFVYGALVFASSALREAKLADLNRTRVQASKIAVQPNARPAADPPPAFAPRTSAISGKDAQSIAQEHQKARGFEENKGQFRDETGASNQQVKYLLRQPGLNVQLRATGFSYDTYIVEGDVERAKHSKDKSVKPTRAKQPKGEKAEHKKRTPSTVKFHRVDIDLVGANPNAEIETSEVLASTTNYLGKAARYMASEIIHRGNST